MIYIDNIFYWPGRIKGRARLYGRWWCHLWGDNIEELHLFAKGIGLRREYFRDKVGFPHYDLTANKRNIALLRGAVEKTLYSWMREKRNERLCTLSRL